LEPFVKDVCEGKHSLYEDPAWEWAVQETDPAILENEGYDDHVGDDTIMEELEMDIDSALGPNPDIELPSTIHEDQISTFTTPSIFERQRANSVSSTITSTTATPIASVFTHSSGSSIYNTTISIQSQETLPRKLSSASPALSSIPEPDYVPFPTVVTAAPTPLVSNGPTRTSRASSTACKPNFICGIQSLKALCQQFILIF
jgi:hypothetical protein